MKSIPRIADILGLIDERHISEAMDYRRKKSNTVWLRFGALAACMVLVVGIAVYAAGSNLFNRRPDPLPFPPVPPQPDGPILGGDNCIVIPSPFGEDHETGGDAHMGFYMTTDLRLGYIDMMFVNMVGAEAFEDWANRTSSSNGGLTAVDEAANLYSFIKYFEIPEDTARETLHTLQLGLDDDLTDEEIELILSDDAEAIAEHFAAETAIRKGKNLYSMFWIYVHPISDYEEEGITPEDIELKVPYFAEVGLTDEAREMLEKKLSEYIVPTGDGTTYMYKDYTIIYNDKLPMSMKEFVIIGHDSVSEEILYLIDNDRSDGDENIYAALYMWDQLINLGYDSEKSYEAYEAFCSQHGRSEYYKERTDIPLGTVVRLAWDGTAETRDDDMPRRLTWLSRLQFPDSDSVYTEAELQSYIDRLGDTHLDEDDFAEFVEKRVEPKDLGNGYELIPRLEPYDLAPDFTGGRNEVTAHFDEYAPLVGGNDCSIITPAGGDKLNYWYLCDYRISEKESFTLKALASDSVNPRMWSDYEVKNALGNGKMSERVTLYNYDGYRIMFFDYPLEDGAGGYIYGYVYKLGEPKWAGKTLGDYEDIQAWFDAKNPMPHYSSGQVAYEKRRYDCLPYHPSGEEIEEFISCSKFIGLSIYHTQEADGVDEIIPEYSELTMPGSNLFNKGDFEYYGFKNYAENDLEATNLLKGTPLYLYGDYIMAVPDEPIYNGNLEPIAARLYRIIPDWDASKADYEDKAAFERYLADGYAAVDKDHFLTHSDGTIWYLCEDVPTRGECSEFRYVADYYDTLRLKLDQTTDVYADRAFPEGEEQGSLYLYKLGGYIYAEYDEPVEKPNGTKVYGRIYRKR